MGGGKGGREGGRGWRVFGRKLEREGGNGRSLGRREKEREGLREEGRKGIEGAWEEGRARGRCMEGVFEEGREKGRAGGREI